MEACRSELDLTGNSVDLVKYAMYAYVVSFFEPRADEINRKVAFVTLKEISTDGSFCLEQMESEMALEDDLDAHSSEDNLIVDDRDKLLEELKEALAKKDRDNAILTAALKRKNVEIVDLNDEAGVSSNNENSTEPPSKRAHTEGNAAASTTFRAKEEVSDKTEEEEELTVIETAGHANGRVTRSMINTAPTVKNENIVHGDIRCPDRACNKIISFADGRGCNVMTCRHHSPSFLYFCIHCKEVATDGYATCECPSRNTMEARKVAQKKRNLRSRQNPEVLE